MTKFSAAVAALAMLPARAAALSTGASSLRAAETAMQKMLRATSDGLVAPLRVDQKLLVCNAYPSDSPITALLNGQDLLGGGGAKGAIAFKECRYVQSAVQRQDRLDFDLGDAEVQGTFEVGDLPSGDAVLLLVLEKRADSPMLRFQSFAFPSATNRPEAQVAVINTFGSAPRLQMQDHMVAAPAEGKPAQRRSEELNFNRVYSIEQGSYETSILEAAGNATKPAPRVVNLAKGTNYVLLRTQSGDAGESLLVFPETPLSAPAAPSSSMGAWFSAVVHKLFGAKV